MHVVSHAIPIQSKAAPQEALRDLDTSFKNFFRTAKQKKGRKCGIHPAKHAPAADGSMKARHWQIACFCARNAA